jgi:hypothetical protein
MSVAGARVWQGPEWEEESGKTPVDSSLRPVGRRHNGCASFQSQKLITLRVNDIGRIYLAFP